MITLRLALAGLLSSVMACGGAASTGGTTPADASRIRELEARVEKLEARLAKSGDALDFLDVVYQQQAAQEQANKEEEHAANAMFAVEIAENVQLGMVQGSPAAPVTIVEVFDFACPYCSRVRITMDELVREYDGKVRVVYKNLVVHRDVATDAHLASCAAAKQGKYKPFHDAVWKDGFDPYVADRDPKKLAEAGLLKIAKAVGLNTTKLKTDMRGEDCKGLLSRDAAELEKFKVNATPTFFINGKHVGGALPKEAFKAIIDAQLAAVASSGVPGGEYYAKVVLAKGEKKFRSVADEQKR
jgi:protein-disulfide isomerase